MAPVLYYLRISGPCRSVQLTADILGVELKLENVDLFKDSVRALYNQTLITAPVGEHLSLDFLKINPHHTVPTYKDDKITLSESRAIMCYLVNQYASPANASLYPADPVKRALVDQALFWDATTLYPAIRAVIFPIVRGDGKLNQDSVKTVDEKLELLNQDLGRNDFVAGSELTIADLSVLAAWTSIEAIKETGVFDTSKLTNIHAWFKRIQQSKRIKNWDELVVESAKAYGEIIKTKLASQ